MNFTLHKGSFLQSIIRKCYGLPIPLTHMAHGKGQIALIRMRTSEEVSEKQTLASCRKGSLTLSIIRDTSGCLEKYQAPAIAVD